MMLHKGIAQTIRVMNDESFHALCLTCSEKRHCEKKR